MTEQGSVVASGPVNVAAGRRGPTGLAVLAGIAFLATDALYFSLIQSQGGAVDPATISPRLELLLGGMAVAAVAGGLAPDRRIRVFLLSAVGLAGLCLGILSLWSIGALVLVGTVLVIVALAMTAIGIRLLSGAALAVAGGAAALVALAAVFVPGMSPSVTCLPHGAGYNSGWSLGGGGSTSGGDISIGPDGRTATGSGVDNGRAYHFTCRDGKLVEFTQGR